MRLINVDALRADYGMAEDCKNCKTGYRSCEYDRIYSKMDFCGWLDDAPTVDAVPVRHGRWIPVYSSDAFGGDEVTWSAHGDPIAYYYCSVCREQARAGEDGESLLTDYCPDCGARMDGDGNG